MKNNNEHGKIELSFFQVFRVFFIIPHSKFDVERSMLDVHLLPRNKTT